jgi:hypothetical protein
VDASTVDVFGRIIISGDIHAATHDRGEDHDSGFATPDPAPEPAPRLVPGHAGGGGTLGGDQTLIPEAECLVPDYVDSAVGMKRGVCRFVPFGEHSPSERQQGAPRQLPSCSKCAGWTYSC